MIRFRLVSFVTNFIAIECKTNDRITGIRTLPIGTGIIFGAAFNLLLFGLFKGRTTYLMIFWTAVMTVFTACISLADRHNLNPEIYVRPSTV